MSITIFARQAGRVIAFTDPALPAVSSVKLQGFGGFEATRSIITRVAFSGQANAQFRHSIGGAVHLYTFGDRIGSIMVSGLSFDTGCDGSEFNGLQRVIKYYDDNRVSERGLPIKVTVGASISLRAYLMAISADIADVKTRVYQYQLQMVMIPTPPKKRKKTQISTTESESANTEFETGSAGDVAETDTSPSSDENGNPLPRLPTLTAQVTSNWDQGGAYGGPLSSPLSAGSGYSAFGTGPSPSLARGFN